VGKQKTKCASSNQRAPLSFATFLSQNLLAMCCRLTRVLMATIIHALGPIVSALIFSHFDPNRTKAGQLNKASPHLFLFYKASSR
jgi:hypothetical protein